MGLCLSDGEATKEAGEAAVEIKRCVVGPRFRQLSEVFDPPAWTELI